MVAHETLLDPTICLVLGMPWTAVMTDRSFLAGTAARLGAGRVKAVVQLVGGEGWENRVRERMPQPLSMIISQGFLIKDNFHLCLEL